MIFHDSFLTFVFDPDGRIPLWLLKSPKSHGRGAGCRSVPAQLDTDGSSDEERGARLGGSAREPFLEVPVEEEEKYGKNIENVFQKLRAGWSFSARRVYFWLQSGSICGTMIDSISVVVTNALRTCCDSTNALGVTSHTKKKTHSN